MCLPSREVHLGYSSSRNSLPPKLEIRLSTVSGLSRDSLAGFRDFNFAGEGASMLVDAALIGTFRGVYAAMRVRQSLQIQGRSCVRMFLVMTRSSFSC